MSFTSSHALTETSGLLRRKLRFCHYFENSWSSRELIVGCSGFEASSSTYEISYAWRSDTATVCDGHIGVARRRSLAKQPSYCSRKSFDDPFFTRAFGCRIIRRQLQRTVTGMSIKTCIQTKGRTDTVNVYDFLATLVATV